MKFRVFLMESERGWGRNYWHEDFATYEEAKAQIKHINSQNKPGPAPDYYMQAEDRIEAVE